MSFLILLGYCIVWGAIAWFVARFLASSIKNRLSKWVLQFTFFGFLVAAPLADEVIGRKQFTELCRTEVKISLSPNWMNVKSAKGLDGSTYPLPDYAVPIYKTKYDYIDIETGQVFLSTVRLGRQGGFVVRRMGIGEMDRCMPPNQSEVYKMIDIDRLIKEGRGKAAS